MIRLGRRLLKLSLLTLTFHSVGFATDDPQLREILNKHLDAMGGMLAWSKVESIQFNGTLERDGQVFDIVIVKKRPNQIRATVTLPIPGKDDEKLQIIRAHDGKTAWTATRLAGAPEMQKQELPPEAAQELLADAGVLPLLIKLWRECAKLELKEPTSLNGLAAFNILVNPKNSEASYHFYLSSEDYHLLRYECHHRRTGITTTTLSDYTTESEIRVPSLSIVNSDSTGRSVMATQSVEIGVGIYEEYFGLGQKPQTAQAD